MRIDPKVAVPPTALEPRDSAPAGKPAAAPAAASVVKLSTAGASVSAGTRTGTTQRLERIRELLDKGEYPVDLDMLAERIVDDDVLRGGRNS